MPGINIHRTAQCRHQNVDIIKMQITLPQFTLIPDYLPSLPAASALGLANSVFYGGKEVVTVHDAVMRIGIREVCKRLMSSAINGTVDFSHCLGFKLEWYWRDALAVSFLSQMAGNYLGGDYQNADRVGLFHNLGDIALAHVSGLVFDGF